MKKSLLLILLSSSSLALAADQTHFPSNEDLRHFRSINAPRVSPDGKKVVIHIAESAADGGKTHLWVIEVPSNSYRQLTFTPNGLEKEGKYRGENRAQWMPDGENILFLSHRGEHAELFRLPMRGGEPVAFDLKIPPPVDDSKLPNALPPPEKTASEDAKKAPEPVSIDVSGFEISPDGKTIALWAEDPQTPGEKHQEEEKADAVWVDHGTHMTRLYLLDVATSKLTPVAVPPETTGVSWSPDSNQLIAEVQAPNSAGDLGPARSAYVVDRNNLDHPTKLDLPPTADSTAWADAQNIFFLAQAQEDAPPGISDLYHFSIANHSTADLTRGFSGSIGGSRPIIVNGAAIEDVENGVRIGFARFDAAKPPPQNFDLGSPVARDLATNAARSAWVFIASSSTHPDSLEYTESLGSPARALALPPLAPTNLQSAPSKLISWQSDGHTIEGLLYLPPDTSAKVPLIVDVHGGPTGSWLDTYDQFTNFLVGHGWAVLRPNPRGSTGHGAAFAAANKNDLGGGDYRDVMAGVDFALKNFPIHPNRLALFGYSYGGEMAGFVEGKTNRFRAIISGAPVIDQFSEYGTEDESWYDRWFFGKPWMRTADALRQSPLAGAGHASTPFMLLQGREDATDPAGQSREMYRALRQMNVPVELVEYPRDNHGPLARAIVGEPTSEPWHGFDARRRIIEFIEKAFGETTK